MISSLPQKTPISLLQELCARNGLTPEYKLLSVEGVVHAPTFMYRVQVGEVYASATGQSKKKAKHAAAKAILEKLMAGQGGLTTTPVTEEDKVDAVVAPAEPIPTETCEVVVPHDDGISGNPVGKLQEKCMKKRLRPPYYETTDEKGPPHERTFVMTCYVNSFAETGIGKSKRLAKRQAAQKMLEKLEKVECLKGEVNGNGNYNDPMLFNHDFMDLEDIKIQKCDAGHTMQLEHFINRLKEAESNTLTKLHKEPLTDDTDYVGILKNLSEEKEFDVIYLPLEERTTKSMFQCLVQISSSLPIAVCCGSGPLPEKAKQDAAHTALEYLKIMTKK